MELYTFSCLKYVYVLMANLKNGFQRTILFGPLDHSTVWVWYMYIGSKCWCLCEDFQTPIIQNVCIFCRHPKTLS